MAWFGELNAYRVVAGISVELLLLTVMAIRFYQLKSFGINQLDTLLFTIALVSSPVTGIIIGSFSPGGLVVPWLLFGIFSNLLCYGLVSLVIKVAGVVNRSYENENRLKKEKNL